MNRLVLLLASMAAPICACEDVQPTTTTTGPEVSYASREPGSTIQPTNDVSFRLMAADGPTRLVSLKQMITDQGNSCEGATRGILKDAFEGTDEWHVTCSDTGDWIVALTKNQTEVRPALS